MASTSPKPVRSGRVESPAEAEATVFLGNISRGFTQGRMRSFLQENYGPVRNVRFIFDRKTQHHRGFGFALFHDPECARRFHSDYGATGLFLDGYHIKVGVRDKCQSSSSGGSGTGSVDEDVPPQLCDSDSDFGEDTELPSRSPSTPVRFQQPASERRPQSEVERPAVPQALPVAKSIPTVIPASVPVSICIPVHVAPTPTVATHVPPVSAAALHTARAASAPMVASHTPQVLSAVPQITHAGVPSMAPGMLLSASPMGPVRVACTIPAPGPGSAVGAGW